MSRPDPYALATYDYPLPEQLIAHHPIYPRENARLLVYERELDRITHTTFAQLLEFIPQDSLIVLNDTRVLKARIQARKLPAPELDSRGGDSAKSSGLDSGGVDSALDSAHSSGWREIFFHRFLERRDVALIEQAHSELGAIDSMDLINPDRLPYALCVCQVRGRLKLGDRLVCGGGYHAEILGVVQGGYRVVRFFTACTSPLDSSSLAPKPPHYLTRAQVLAMLESIGQTPLPPYIKPTSPQNAQSDYQSIFASHDGAVAAPTASLHISADMLESMRARFSLAFATLHIGAGTFASVNAPDIRKHIMHAESLHISAPNVRKILESTRRLCVGTSALRSVEYLCRAAEQGGMGADSLGLDSGVLDSRALDSHTDSRADFGTQAFSTPESSGLGFAPESTSTESRGSHALDSSPLAHYCDYHAQCDLFLHAGNPPRHAHALLTNFHLPKSTLTMLVASMVGVQTWRRIYEQAIQERYRFYSYGDGMLII